MYFGAHESFHIREGWLRKGLTGIERNPALFSDPYAGDVLGVGHNMVLEPAFSGVQVLNEAGGRVDKGDSQVDPSSPNLLRVSIPALAPGAYKVIWRVLSVDSHVTEGDFPFRVSP